MSAREWTACSSAEREMERGAVGREERGRCTKYARIKMWAAFHFVWPRFALISVAFQAAAFAFI